MECWGAQGGWAGLNSVAYILGGKGGYSYGVATLETQLAIFVVVGGEGTGGNAFLTGYNGGFNGGGNSYGFRNTSNAGGGGATHIADTNGLLPSLTPKHVYMVAGGGGGAACDYDRAGSLGGYGGGKVGGDGAKSPNNDGYFGIGGSQTEGGGCQELSSNYNGHIKPSSGKFGKGGDGATDGGAGAGGGFYGGGGASVWGGAGGGSGYVNSTLLTDAMTIAGKQSFPSPSGTTNETGHQGNGACVITQISF